MTCATHPDVPRPRCHARLVRDGYAHRFTETWGSTGHVALYEHRDGMSRVVVWGEIGQEGEREFVGVRVGEVVG